MKPYLYLKMEIVDSCFKLTRLIRVYANDGLPFKCEFMYMFMKTGPW